VFCGRDGRSFGGLFHGIPVDFLRHGKGLLPRRSSSSFYGSGYVAQGMGSHYYLPDN